MGAERVRVAIIGAGPAGIAAALELAEYGAAPLLLDEAPTPGGRMQSQIHPDPTRPGTWHNGASKVQDMLSRAAASGVRMRMQTEVWAIWRTEEAWHLTLGGPDAEPGESVDADTVLVATGAAQNGLPFPGWTLPGVLSAGAIQTMVYQFGVLPGRQLLVVGSDPLALAVATELPRLGTKVVGVVLPPPGPAIGELASPARAVSEVLRMSHLAPSAALRLLGRLPRAPLARLAAHWFPRRGVRAGDARLLLRHCIVSAEGDDDVQGATLALLDGSGRPIVGSERHVDLDAICVAGGLFPLPELVEATGLAAMAFVEELGGRIPLHGPDMQTTADGLFVAGSATGVEPAEVALAQGRLAGIGMARRLGLLSETEAVTAISAASASIKQARKLAWLSFYPNADRGRERVAELWQASVSTAEVASRRHMEAGLV